MLKEMPPERVAGIPGCFVAGRNPRSALDQVVLRVKRRSREIVVAGMNLKTVKAGDRGLGPLPYVPDDVEELTKPESVHGARRSPMLQVDVPRRLVPEGWSGMSRRSRSRYHSASVGNLIGFRSRRASQLQKALASR